MLCNNIIRRFHGYFVVQNYVLLPYAVMAGPEIRSLLAKPQERHVLTQGMVR